MRQETDALKGSFANFSGFHGLSPQENEGEIPDHTPDCLDDLDKFSCIQHDPDTNQDNSDFLKVLEELSDHFHGDKR